MVPEMARSSSSQNMSMHTSGSADSLAFRIHATCETTRAPKSLWHDLALFETTGACAAASPSTLAAARHTPPTPQTPARRPST